MSKFGYYVPQKRPTSLYIIEKLKGFGSISVLAHPFLNMNEDELREFLPKAKACGLNATEAYYSLFDKAETELAEKICDRRNIALLHKSGGDVCTVYKAVNRAAFDFVIVENLAVFRKIFYEQFVAFLL